MYKPRGLLVHSSWTSTAARNSRLATLSHHPLWRRGYSQQLNNGSSPRRPPAHSASSVGIDRKPPKGLIQDIAQDRKLPRTGIDELHNRELQQNSTCFIQLRDACQCARCVDPQTKQRFFRTSEIPEDIAPRQMRWLDESDGRSNDNNNNDDGQKVLEIHWDKDVPGYYNETTPHVTRFTANELQYPAAYFHHRSVGSEKPRLHWDKNDMEQAQHWISYDDYMHNDDLLMHALDNLSVYGLLFVQDIPDSRETVAKLATRMGPLRNTFYGATWDVRHDPQAQNVAYTNRHLDFHMDLLYTQNPPGFQLLHCLRNSCEGGESLFVDGFGSAMDLDGASWRTLSTFEVPYHYNHGHQYYRATRPVLETTSAGGEGESSRSLNYVNYSPPFQGPFSHTNPATTNGGDWTQRLKEFISGLRQFEDKIQDPTRIFELKLKPGQCVIFENRRVLHARRAFDTTAGERWLAGAYVDEDAVQSRLFTLKRNAGVFQAV